jgi:katanin p80 WD40 repeat-containing subunit B1
MSDRVVRTFGGHRAAVSSIEFHPFGEFFASGSVDNCLKIWDIRRKGCIQTYTGHDGAIRHLKISPDGRWIASGADDGLVNIWDLTAGKLLHTFPSPGISVSSIAFNPTEFVFAINYADGFNIVNDLDTFSEISSTRLDKVKKLLFTPSGDNLLFAGDNILFVRV